MTTGAIRALVALGVVGHVAKQSMRMSYGYPMYKQKYNKRMRRRRR